MLYVNDSNLCRGTMIKQLNYNIVTDVLKALAISEDAYSKEIEKSNVKELSMSVLNCFTGLLLYLKGEFTTALRYFKDSEILLSKNNNEYEKIFYNFILGYVNFCEKNNNLYMLHYNFHNFRFLKIYLQLLMICYFDSKHI